MCYFILLINYSCWWFANNFRSLEKWHTGTEEFDLPRRVTQERPDKCDMYDKCDRCSYCSHAILTLWEVLSDNNTTVLMSHWHIGCFLFCTAAYNMHTQRWRLHTAHWTLNTDHCTLPTEHCTAHCTLQSWHFSLGTTHLTLHNRFRPSCL